MTSQPFATVANPFNQGYIATPELRTLGFKSVGENVHIARNCTIIGLHNIALGNNIRIDGYTVISAHSGNIDIGNHVHIAGACHLAGAGGIMLCDFSGLSQGVRIYSSTDDYTGNSLTNPTVPPRYLGVQLGIVRLGKHVIVGSGSVILPGVDIGDGSSIGALSLVTKSLDPWGVYFGSPVRRLKARSRNLLELERQLLSQAAAATKENKAK
jgi:galactoside O-acetyltransferase